MDGKEAWISFVKQLVPSDGLRQGYKCDYLNGNRGPVVDIIKQTSRPGSKYMSIMVNTDGEMTIIHYHIPSKSKKFGHRLCIHDPESINGLWDYIKEFYTTETHPAMAVA